MAVGTKGNLFAVNSRHHLVKRVEFYVDGFDMFNMVHFYVLTGSAIRAGLPEGTDGRNFSVLFCQWVGIGRGTVEPHGVSNKGWFGEVEHCNRSVSFSQFQPAVFSK